VELDVRGSFERRSFVDWILGAGITGTAVSFLYPVLKFVIPPPVAEAIDLNVVAAAVEELPPNAAKIL
jgi:cytochrome b6-f complex iron-sulfur subunit